MRMRAVQAAVLEFLRRTMPIHEPEVLALEALGWALADDRRAAAVAVVDRIDAGSLGGLQIAAFRPMTFLANHEPGGRPLVISDACGCGEVLLSMSRPFHLRL